MSIRTQKYRNKQMYDIYFCIYFCISVFISLNIEVFIHTLIYLYIHFFFCYLNMFRPPYFLLYSISTLVSSSSSSPAGVTVGSELGVSVCQPLAHFVRSDTQSAQRGGKCAMCGCCGCRYMSGSALPLKTFCCRWRKEEKRLKSRR